MNRDIPSVRWYRTWCAIYPNWPPLWSGPCTSTRYGDVVLNLWSIVWLHLHWMKRTIRSPTWNQSEIILIVIRYIFTLYTICIVIYLYDIPMPARYRISHEHRERQSLWHRHRALRYCWYHWRCTLRLPVKQYMIWWPTYSERISSSWS